MTGKSEEIAVGRLVSVRFLLVLNDSRYLTQLTGAVRFK